MDSGFRIHYTVKAVADFIAESDSHQSELEADNELRKNSKIFNALTQIENQVDSLQDEMVKNVQQIKA